LELPLDELEAAFNDRTRAILSIRPNNPTGKVFLAGEAEAIAKLCCKWDIVAFCDDLRATPLRRAPHISLASLPGMRERSVTINAIVEDV